MRPAEAAWACRALADAALADGLAVDYYFEVFNSIDDLLDGMDPAKPKAGPPLPRLDDKVGIAKVLTAADRGKRAGNFRGDTWCKPNGHYRLVSCMVRH